MTNRTAIIRTFTLALATVLLTTSLAGCLNGPGDGPTDGPDQELADGSGTRSGNDTPVNTSHTHSRCAKGQTLNATYKRLREEDPPNGSREQCWLNGNRTDGDEESFYFYVQRTRGAGTLNLTILDGNDTVFLNKEFAAGELHCNDAGKVASTGNWTVRASWTDFEGAARLRIDMGERGDWECPDS